METQEKKEVHNSHIMGTPQTLAMPALYEPHPLGEGEAGRLGGPGKQRLELPPKRPHAGLAGPALSSCTMKGPFRAQPWEQHKNWESLHSLNEINVSFQAPPTFV